MKEHFKKWLFEQACAPVKHYHSGNGIFTSDMFAVNCKKKEQTRSFYGIGAQHQIDNELALGEESFAARIVENRSQLKLKVGWWWWQHESSRVLVYTAKVSQARLQSSIANSPLWNKKDCSRSCSCSWGDGATPANQAKTAEMCSGRVLDCTAQTTVTCSEICLQGVLDRITLKRTATSSWCQGICTSSPMPRLRGLDF